MKPTITFDKSACKFILKAFNKTINTDGYIKDLKTNKIEKCGICKYPIHFTHFAGILSRVGFLCDEMSCILSISDKIKGY
jgi:hypothetical protein